LKNAAPSGVSWFANELSACPFSFLTFGPKVTTQTLNKSRNHLTGDTVLAIVIVIVLVAVIEGQIIAHHGDF
jgi:hypothetical protein